MAEIETLFETKWLTVCRSGTWDFVRRPQSHSSVSVLALTPANEIVLVEQFRVPVQRRVIEMPAGIAGDEPEFIGESLAETASRELLEETGYRAGKVEFLIRSPSTPGLAEEFMNIFLATDLVRETEGGGTEHEDITIHHVPVKEIRNWVAARQAEGTEIDTRLHAALWLAGIGG